MIFWQQLWTWRMRWDCLLWWKIHGLLFLAYTVLEQIKAPMQYSAHQACAYGGERPKWTVLAWNHPALAAISKCCPGESPLHKYKGLGTF